MKFVEMTVRVCVTEDTSLGCVVRAVEEMFVTIGTRSFTDLLDRQGGKTAGIGNTHCVTHACEH